MPIKAPTACSRCGRAKPCACKPEPMFANTHAYKLEDEIHQLYMRASWRKFSKLLRNLNPTCLRIIGGKQCSNPSELVHHIVSPRHDRSQFLSTANCVPICKSCHNNDEGEMRGYVYAPTKGILGSVFPHLIDDQQPGAIGTRAWFAANSCANSQPMLPSTEQWKS